ncbi:CRISPR-associated protein Cas4 [Desulfobacca acetoxidans]
MIDISENILDDVFQLTDPGYSISATDILEYLYCPRFAYFESYLCIPEHQEKRFKVQTGRTVHEDKARLNPNYLRKKLGVVERKKSVYLSSTRGMRGIVDEILFLKDGSAAPLDYKYAEYKERTFKNHRFQLTFYGLLIRDNYSVPVNKGYIVYTRSRNKLIEVEITESMYNELHDIIAVLTSIVVQGKYPPPTKAKARCLDCCYRNICEKVI